MSEGAAHRLARLEDEAVTVPKHQEVPHAGTVRAESTTTRSSSWPTMASGRRRTLRVVERGLNSPRTRVPIVARRKRGGNMFATTLAQPGSAVMRSGRPGVLPSAACGLRQAEGMDAPS